MPSKIQAHCTQIGRVRHYLFQYENYLMQKIKGAADCAAAPMLVDHAGQLPRAGARTPACKPCPYSGTFTVVPVTAIRSPATGLRAIGGRFALVIGVAASVRGTVLTTWLAGSAAEPFRLA